jgi:succinate dehydrogenase/fumarate reductase iron-sulfur protein
VSIEQKSFRTRIYRYDPESPQPPCYEDHQVAGTTVSRVLDVLRSIFEGPSGDLAFQYACRIGRCGTCSVRVNGKPVLACQERATDDMVVEPLAPFPVLRDLVVDRGAADEKYRQLRLTPQREAPHPARRERISPETARDVGSLGSCISCMVCVSTCPAVADRRFDGPAFMLQLRRLAEHPADRDDRKTQALDSGLLECYGCDACTQLCPADLSPADAIRSFRRETIFGARPKPSTTPGGAA